jgi:hypothetical protein
MTYSPYASLQLARYTIRASFSQERMTYLPEESKVIYESKDAQKEKVFDALEWSCPVKYLMLIVKKINISFIQFNRSVAIESAYLTG